MFESLVPLKNQNVHAKTISYDLELFQEYCFSYFYH
jgi:hypothetical protein